MSTQQATLFKPTIYTSKDALWINADGDPVPISYVPAIDRKREVWAGKILKNALSVEQSIKALHTMMAAAFQEIADLIAKEYEITYKKPKAKGKGSFTWFNFDRSVKVESDITELIKWDEFLMKEAYNILTNYLESEIGSKNVLVNGLVQGAFANRKGMIDTGKVFQILSYEDRIKDADYSKACQLMKSAQKIDRTKLYMRVWVRDEDGSYRNINLNFSAF